MHEKKYQNIIQLSNEERYGYLVRKVADFETIYLIHDNFWKISRYRINGIECIKVFPEKEFGMIHVSSEKSKKVKKKNLYKFIKWIEKDHNASLNLAVFPNNENEVKIIKGIELKNDILEECKQYE